MTKGYSKPAFPFTVLLIIISSTFMLYAYSTGITQATKKNGEGCICHAPQPFANVNVVISGPAQVQINSVNTYTVTISGGPLVRGGTNIAALNGTLANTNSDLQIISGELTHVAPKLPVSGSVTFQFNYTAPATQGFDTLYANGNSVNFNGFNDGDQWNFANNFAVQVMTIVPVELSGFSANVNGQNIGLNWKTASEKNNMGFEIERSTTENEWTKVAFVDGAGNSTSENQYYFEDKNLSPAVYIYRLKQIDFDGSVEIHNLKGEYEIAAPKEFSLEQNYPNPFNPATTINYNLSKPANVELKIYNTLGVETATLVNGVKNEGYHSVNFNGAELTSGVYYYRLNIYDETKNSLIVSDVKKMLLVK